MRRRTGQRIAQAPWPFAVAMLLAHLGLMVLVARILPPLQPTAFPDLGSTVVNLVSILLGLAVVAWLGWWRRAALTRLLPRRRAWTLLPLLLMPLSYLVWGVGGSPAAWLSGLALFLVLGANEELINRGIIQGALQERGRRTAVLGSAVLFGLGHAVGGLAFGRDWGPTLAQMVSSTAYGVSIGAVRDRIGTIWPLALFHGLDDLVLRHTHVPPWWHLALVFLNLGYGVWLLRRPG